MTPPQIFRRNIHRLYLKSLLVASPSYWRLKTLCMIASLLSSLWMISTASAEEPFFSSELIFPLHPQHNHAPGIVELTDGELLVSWYRGSGERKADDVAVYGARKKPNQKEWTDAFLMVDTPGFPDGNTFLYSTRSLKRFQNRSPKNSVKKSQKYDRDSLINFSSDSAGNRDASRHSFHRDGFCSHSTATPILFL